MSLLNIQDFNEYANSSHFETTVNVNGGEQFYYYSTSADNYYYIVKKTFTTTDSKIAELYAQNAFNSVSFLNNEYEIISKETIIVYDATLEQQITEAFNKQINNYKKAKAKKEADNKSKEQKDYDSGLKEAYNKKAKYGYDYDTDITTYTFKHKELVYPVFASTIAKKLLVYKSPGYSEFYPDEGSSNLSSQEVWNVLSDRISKAKEKSDELKKTIKEKELKKTSSEVKPEEIGKKNIENIPNKNLQKEIKKESEANKKTVKEAKPKLVIKIPKPFAKGYFIIDLSALLGMLLGLLSAFLMGLLMSKIGDILSGLLSSLLNGKSKINASAITNAVNSINMTSLIQEAMDEENILLLNSTINNIDKTKINISSDLTTTIPINSDISYDSASKIDSTGTFSEDIVDVTSDSSNKTNIKPKTNKIFKKNDSKDFYTMNKRGRTDLLESSTVSERLDNNNTNKKVIYNPNYGRYR